MLPTFLKSTTVKTELPLVVILSAKDDIFSYCENEQELKYVKEKLEDKSEIVELNRYSRQIYFVKPDSSFKPFQLNEHLRNVGCQLYDFLASNKSSQVQITTISHPKYSILSLCEGLALSSYKFTKYKNEKPPIYLEKIILVNQEFTEEELFELQTVVEANFIARDLVNEPFGKLNALQIAEAAERLGKEAGFDVEILHKKDIEKLKMGGLLGVNQGSIDPPTFTIMEYLPENPINSQPYVLVGKGVVFDTGGLSLKTNEGMSTMKCDMGGAAVVIGTMYAVAKNNLPIHVVGLVPATDNRPGMNAITLGDVLTMYTGKTVEVLNTDAEGRLILADALGYASRFNPELVMDFATLTGSAARAIGKEGIVYLAKCRISVKNDLEHIGREVYERLVEFPLWDEYDQYIKSDIADIKNVGGPDAGAITAAKFLQHFINYDWVHFDIAGPAFLPKKDSYRGKNGTGVGVRLAYHFLKSRIH